MKKNVKKLQEAIAIVLSIAFLASILYFPVFIGNIRTEKAFHGTVLDEKGNPMSSASVTMAGNESSSTGRVRKGKYRFSGKYTNAEWKETKKLSFSSPGYVTSVYSINSLFMMDDENGYNFGTVRMAKDGSKGKIEGDIAIKEGARPLFGEEVKLYEGLNVKKGKHLTTGTDKKGHYSFSVKPGYYTLVIEDDDFKIDYVRPIVLSAGKTVKIRPIAATKKATVEYHDDFWDNYLWYYLGRMSRK